MAQTAILASPISQELNPYVGELADRLIGVTHSDKSAVGSDQWALITEVLNFAAEAEQRLITQKRRISHLEALSMTDELTGLANRRAFDEFMHKTLAAARRYRETGTILYVDLDGFKQTNDRLGHEAGDQVLCEVADVLTRHTRPSDLVVRRGGDEFLVVLTRCQAREGKLRARTLGNIINSSVVHYDGQTIHIKASIGTAIYGPRTSIGDVLRKADHEMLRHKHGKGATAKRSTAR